MIQCHVYAAHAQSPEAMGYSTGVDSLLCGGCTFKHQAIALAKISAYIL